MTREPVDNVPPTSASLLVLVAVRGVPWGASGCLGVPWGALVLVCMISITGTTGTTQKRPCCWEQHCRGWMGFAQPSFFCLFQTSWQNAVNQIPAFPNWISRGRGCLFYPARDKGDGRLLSPPFLISRQRRRDGDGPVGGEPRFPSSPQRHAGIPLPAAPAASQSIFLLFFPPLFFLYFSPQ